MKFLDSTIKQLCTSNSNPQSYDAHEESDLLVEPFLETVLDLIMDAKEQP